MPIGHVTLVVITGTTILVPYLQVKTLQLIWRWGTRWWNLWVPHLQMSCRDLTSWQGARIVVPVMATRVTPPAASSISPISYTNPRSPSQSTTPVWHGGEQGWVGGGVPAAGGPWGIPRHQIQYRYLLLSARKSPLPRNHHGKVACGLPAQWEFPDWLDAISRLNQAPGYRTIAMIIL